MEQVGEADEAGGNRGNQAVPRISDAPDWLYVLREFYELYRFSSAGGSGRIRGHMRNVREAIGRLVKDDAALVQTGPLDKPVTGHLGRALDEGRADRLAPMVRAIEHLRPALAWQYGYDRVPKGLARKYAFAEIAGPHGPVSSPDVILGLVLFAPGCIYPAHAHAGLTESYVCLSGAVSENDLGVFAPGSLILNPPEHMHRITVSAGEPALLAYAWTGPREALAGQKMTLGRSRAP